MRMRLFLLWLMLSSQLYAAPTCISQTDVSQAIMVQTGFINDHYQVISKPLYKGHHRYQWIVVDGYFQADSPELALLQGQALLRTTSLDAPRDPTPLSSNDTWLCTYYKNANEHTMIVALALPQHAVTHPIADDLRSVRIDYFT